jgi:stage II sporulation protein M
MKRYIIISFLIFFIPGLLWFSVLAANPNLSHLIDEQLQEALQPIVDMVEEAEPWQLILGIFINNIVKSFLAVALGLVFGIYTVFFLFVNGAMMGTLGAFAVHQEEFLFFLSAILPHGIIEIPVMIFTGAIGLKLAKESFLLITGKEHTVRKQLRVAYSLFWKYVLPLLALAAAVEVYITPRIMMLFVGS